eukprot:1835261-Amphidinium_carterae.2
MCTELQRSAQGLVTCFFLLAPWHKVANPWHREPDCAASRSTLPCRSETGPQEDSNICNLWKRNRGEQQNPLVFAT